jgi:hypothetical protein
MAYSVLDPFVNYMQGMNFVAAMLLLNICDEEESFWALTYFMLPKGGLYYLVDAAHGITLLISGKHNWRSVFMPGMPKAFAIDKALKKSLLNKVPKLLQIILEETDGESLFPAFGSLYLSVFLADCPYETSRRLFEVFLL